MEQAEINATNLFFEKTMAWLWKITDEKKDLEKLVPLYLSRPTGVVHDAELRLDKEGNVWKATHDKEGLRWDKLKRNDSDTVFSPYRVIESRRLESDFIKYAPACLHEDWCWEMKPAAVTPFSQLQFSLASHIKAIALGDLLLIKRDDISLWLVDYARSKDILPGQETLIKLYQQFCPGLEVNETELQLFYPNKVQEALNTVLIKLQAL